MTTATADLRETIKLLPGYDPYRDAEGYEFRPEIAQRVIDFFHECLTHVKGELAGRPLYLHPWQQAILGNLFGWINKKTGYRRYRESLIYIPRKAGKTTLCAGIPLWMLFCDGEPGAEVYCAATSKDQASLLYGLSKAMVIREPELNARAKIYRALKSMECKDDPGSVFRVLSADADRQDGYNSHCVVVDELHAQPDRELIDVLETSFGSRRQPLLIHITTADFHRPSICNEKHAYALKVRDGILKDPTFLPAIWEASPDDDWHDPEVWKRVNPNFGISPTEEYFEAKHRKAIAEPSFENTFKRRHLNIKTEQDERWLPIDKWNACSGEVDLEELEGERCWGGLDLSSTQDITALVLVFRRDEGGYKVAPFFWVPAENAEKRERQDRVPYLTWERQGFLKLTDGNAVDYDAIRQDIGELGDRFNIDKLGMDKWNATQLANQLMEDGFEVEFFRQGFGSLSAASKDLEKLVVSCKLAHGGNPVLGWMASNVGIDRDHSGNIRPSKKKSTERIDGIVALIMAIGEAVAAGEEHDGPSLFSLESDS